MGSNVFNKNISTALLQLLNKDQKAHIRIFDAKTEKQKDCVTHSARQRKNSRNPIKHLEFLEWQKSITL
jgi:hypothetical protein